MSKLQELEQKLCRLKTRRQRLNEQISYTRNRICVIKESNTNSNMNSNTNSNTPPSPLVSPDEKESSKGKVNPSISPLINPPKPPKRGLSAADAARRGIDDARFEEMFAEFWATYPKSCPRRVAKAKCRDKYRRLMRNKKQTLEGAEALHKEILAGIERCKRSALWTEKDGQYICAPLVFLNQKRWQDEVLTAPKTGATLETYGKFLKPTCDNSNWEEVL